jgi:SpoVK/Ycf46/Vps4 family AAA+-type ATPase
LLTTSQSLLSPLPQLEGVDSNNDGVLFMGATNLPWEIDPAMIRRFQKKILIPLPEAPARVRMFVSCAAGRGVQARARVRVCTGAC